jgi:hypothetical protein
VKVRRVPLVDEYVEDGESAVLVGDRVLVLSPLATTVLSLLGEEWTEVSWVAERLAMDFGAPVRDDTERATIRALWHLSEQGLLVLAS